MSGITIFDELGKRVFCSTVNSERYRKGPFVRAGFQEHVKMTDIRYATRNIADPLTARTSYFANLEVNIHARFRVDRNWDILLDEGLEPRGLHSHLVASHNQVPLGVITRFVGGSCVRHVALNIAGRDFGTGDHAAGSILDGSHDTAVDCLGEKRLGGAATDY
jgi:hypothetical protein